MPLWTPKILGMAASLTYRGVMTPASGSTSPHDHAVSFYDHDGEAITALVRYVVSGLVYGERVIVVATERHQAALDRALRDVHSIDDSRERAGGNYVTLDAAQTLARFMVDGVPDPARFRASVGALLAQACAPGVTVRVFGEMVALLWDEDNVAGAIALEELWNSLADEHAFHLLCAYPTGPLREAGLDDIARVCETHSSVRPPANYSLSVPRSPAPTIPIEQSEVFLPVPEAAAAMRRFVAGVLRSWGDHDLLWDANLIATELATNALSNGGSPFRAYVTRTGGVVRLRVEDNGSGVPVQRRAGESGRPERGVAVVGKLADRWGYDEQPGVTVTWAELSTAPAHAG